MTDRQKEEPGGSSKRYADNVLSGNQNPSFLLSPFGDKRLSLNRLQTEEYTIVVKPPDAVKTEEKQDFWEYIRDWKTMSICQGFSNLKYFMAFFCIPMVCQGILFSFVDLTTGIFYQENSISVYTDSIIILTSDISGFLGFPFLFYFMEKENVPRLIALSSFLVGLGSLFCGIPYFEIGNNLLYNEYEDICTGKEIENSSNKLSALLKTEFIFCIFLGEILQGIASIFLYVFGEVFINNSVNLHSAGVYLGIVESSVFFGYAVGVAVGAHLINPPKDAALRIISEGWDPAYFWHQTWWRYFICVSCVAWSTIIPLLCFQQKKQGKRKIKSSKSLQSFSEDKSKEQDSESRLKEIYASILVVMKSPIFVLLSLAKAMEYLHTIGASEFIPTFIEHQFLLSKKTATFISGIILIPAGAIGYILGGVISSHLRLSGRGLIRLIMISSTTSLILFAFITLSHCDRMPFAGLNEDYDGKGKLLNLTAPCNSHCQCLTSFYSPICGRDGVTYFSSCFAGCIKTKIINKIKTYYNCSCINVGLVTVDTDGEFIDAGDEVCDSKCDKLPFSIAVFFSMIIFSGISGIPEVLLILRSAPDKDRLLTFGLSLMLARLFGSIPGPILIKLIAEYSCLFRNIETAGTEGNCWLYDTSLLAKQLLVLCFLCKVLIFVFTFISTYWYKTLPQERMEKLPRRTKKRRRKTNK